ncbi:MAG: hypothetical protein DMF60_08030 [Acidobacteria bacterium]|nr:MAG: hypothetical protein DMF60_08030 [Acidobacteriota bacterium]
MFGNLFGLKSTRFFLFLLIAGGALLGSACVRRINVNELLPVRDQLSTDQLIDRINAYSQTQTFAAQADVTVWNYFTGEGAKADEFPAATGLIRFKRPDDTRMNVTFIGAKVAEMVSDGQKFKLAIYRPQEKRRFIYGSNLADIERMNASAIKETKDPQLTKAGGLINMRPQHITDSFLIKPITASDRPNAFREEVRQVEADIRPGKKNRLVERSYYVVYVLERDEKSQLKLRRKFWFDRTQTGTPLVRQQTFENGVGRLASDVTYSNWFTAPNSTSVWPGHVTIDRRNDGYRLDLMLVAETVEVNAGLPSTTFDLQNIENLEEMNLDAPHKASTEPPRKPNAPIPAKMQQHAGEVVSVDATKNEIIIKDEAGTEAHLLIISSTKVTRSGRSITLADVRAGDKVASECESTADGCKAKSIVVTSPAP